MDPPPSQIEHELSSFRQRWRAEVTSRRPGQPSSQQQQQQEVSLPPLKTARFRRPAGSTVRATPEVDLDHDYVAAPVFEEAEGTSLAVTARTGTDEAVSEDAEAVAEDSALSRYEQAVEREAAGSLGESLQLYRQAYRMDPKVDQQYKNKHFKAAWSSKKALETPETVPEGDAILKSAIKPEKPMSLQELLFSFAHLSIAPAPAAISGTAPPPCPIADLPEEILVNILQHVAVSDIADYMRLAQVCKRLAWLVTTEDRIWRRVCLRSEVGFSAMHHTWQREIAWKPLLAHQLMLPSEIDDFRNEQERQIRTTTRSLVPKEYTTWQSMFRNRPRLRFNGCYISTVNYIRAGQANINSITWNTPVYIVTYYRYLRFFRDGSVISLLTTQEPAHVVHHLTRAALALHRDKDKKHLPSSVMQDALKGRWHLGPAAGDTASTEERPESEGEKDVFVETEGVDVKYMYRMELSLRSAGKAAARNNKMVWRGFYSHNRVSDDWAEFALKNDKPFFFSRVVRYGTGE